MKVQKYLWILFCLDQMFLDIDCPGVWSMFPVTLP